MLLHNLVGDRESKAASFFFRRIEGIKNVFEIFIRDPDPRIPYPDLDELFAAVLREQERRDLDDPPAINGLDGIQDNVHAYLFYLFFVNKNFRQTGGQPPVDLNSLFFRLSL